LSTFVVRFVTWCGFEGRYINQTQGNVSLCGLNVNALNDPNLQRQLSCLMLHQAVFSVYRCLRVALVMEALRIPETSVNIYQTTQHKIQEDSHLDIRRPEKLNSDISLLNLTL
jgi:hypothetical protein